MFLRYFIVFTAISICVRAHPSRLKILPGLAFYRTDDGHDDSDNSLMDKDKDLLKSMWNIVDKMDTKNQHPGEPAPGTGAYPAQGNIHDSSNQDRRGTPAPYPPKPTPGGHPGSPGAPGSHGHPPGSRQPPIGTPITTINVYSTYPAQSVKGGAPFTATTTYHHVPQYHGSAFEATPFSSTSDLARNRDNRFNQNLIPNPPPSFDMQKDRRQFDPFMPPPNNQMPFEPQPSQQQDGMISQAQYESLMNPNVGMGPPFDPPLENSENLSHSMYEPSQGDDMGQGYGSTGMENPAGSAPLHFRMPHMNMNPNGQMRSMDDMMQENFQLMNSDPIRSQMN